MLLLLGVVALSIEPASTTTTHKPPHEDHLLLLLQAIHKSHAFNKLPSSEKVLLVELISAAEVDQITHLIDNIGFARIAAFLDRE